MPKDEEPKIERKEYCKLPYVKCDAVCVGVVEKNEDVYDWGRLSVCENFKCDEFAFMGPIMDSTKIELRHNAESEPETIDMSEMQKCHGCQKP